MFSRTDDTDILIAAARERFGVHLTADYAAALLTFIHDTYDLADQQTADGHIGRRLLERLALLSDSRARLVSLRSIVRGDDERAYLKGLLK